MTKESKAEGCIYIILNGTNPNEIKIGLTVDPSQRLKSLFSTSVPAPFIPKKIWYVDDMREAEKIAHCYMDGHRINKKREFFFLVTPSMSHRWAKPDTEMCGFDSADFYIDQYAEAIEEHWSSNGINFKRINVASCFKSKWKN